LLCAFAFLEISLLPCTSCKFAFLEVEFVPQVLLKLFLCTALQLFGLKSLEDLVASLLSCILGSLNLVQTLLLLFRVLSDHFVLESLHFLLTIDQGSLLVHG
jgi:hypothetical protein